MNERGKSDGCVVPAKPANKAAVAVAELVEERRPCSWTWLGRYNGDGRYKGSITVNHNDPLEAAREIERCAGHPHMVQVMTDSGARALFGQRQYYPIYEQCDRYGLPLAIHPGTDGMGTTTS